MFRVSLQQQKTPGQARGSNSEGCRHDLRWPHGPTATTCTVVMSAVTALSSVHDSPVSSSAAEARETLTQRDPRIPASHNSLISAQSQHLACPRPDATAFSVAGAMSPHT